MNQFILNGKGTWTDYELSLDPGYVIPDANPIALYVEVPGRNGSLDLSESLTGSMTYSDRDGFSARFTIIKDRASCEALRQQLTLDLHGKKVTIVEPNDSSHYFVGRLRVSRLEFQGVTGHIEITGRLEPYRYKNAVTVVSHAVTTTKSIVLTNEQKPVIPTIVTDASVQIVHGTNSYSINAGTHTLPIVLVQGDNAITINGTATVTFTYQEGAL